MRRLLILTFIPFLITGCWNSEEAPSSEGPRFCDVEEERRFSQEELDWRGKHAPWNLAKDFRTNLTYERECL